MKLTALILSASVFFTLPMFGQFESDLIKTSQGDVETNGNPYHPKGEGNGYILTFGSTHVLVGGDTENIPEYGKITQAMDVAFLPMNVPYTMTPEMVADAAKTFYPAILYPYHYGQTDPQELVKLLKDEPDIEVRIRDLK